MSDVAQSASPAMRDGETPRLCDMTHEEAKAEAARRNREDPERSRSSWLPRHVEGETWELARVGIPGSAATGTATQAGEPAPREDTRPPFPPDQFGF